MSGNVKLNTPSNGSVTLSTPDTASAVTVTIPAATDTVTLNTQAQTLTNKTLTASGSNTVEATSGPSSTQLAGNRNKIINGAMMIDQRNAGGSIAFSNNSFPVDRFVIAKSSSAVGTAQQLSASPPSGFKNYLGITCTTGATPAAADYNLLWHSVEGLNCADLAWGTSNAKSVTMSFQVYSSKTGTFAGAIVNGGYTRGYVFTYLVSATNTWTYVSVTIPGDTSGTWATDNSIGIKVSFDLGSGSRYQGSAGTWSGTAYYSTSGAQQVMATTGATFYITGVQLEKGSVATPFENRIYSDELAMCQRYCVNYNSANANGPYNSYAIGQCFSSSSHRSTLFLPVQMRAVPSLTVSAASSDYAIYAPAGIINCSSVPLLNYNGTNTLTVGVFSTVSSGLTAGQAAELLSNANNTSYLLFAAEL